MTEEEQAVLYRKFFQVAKPVVYAILHREDEDFVWDIATKGIMELDSFEGAADVLTWFRSLARNACINQLRLERRRNEKSLEELNRAEWAELSIENTALRKLALDGLRYLKGEKELVDAIREGYGFEEIGWAMGVSSKTAQKRWERFLERVRKENKEEQR